jgi:hypothetical protein
MSLASGTEAQHDESLIRSSTLAPLGPNVSLSSTTA